MSTMRTRIGPSDSGRKMSLEEFREADEEEGYRYELAGGTVEVTEIPNTIHRRVVGNLYRAVGLYDHENPGLIETFGGGAEFRLWIPEMISGRNPDLGVVLEGTLPDARGRTQPSLVAEVVSRRSGARDYETKRREYLVFGLHEYWIVDPFLRQVVLLVREGDSWSEQVLRGNQRIPSTLLHSLNLHVSDLWTGLPAVVEDEDDESELAN
jgi:Uma2 family endonuclease